MAKLTIIMSVLEFCTLEKINQTIVCVCNTHCVCVYNFSSKV